jgi:hypothetical protein
MELAAALVAAALTLEQALLELLVRVVLAVMDITAVMNLMVLVAVAVAVLLLSGATLSQTLVALLVRVGLVRRHPYLVHL